MVGEQKGDQHNNKINLSEFNSMECNVDHWLRRLGFDGGQSCACPDKEKNAHRPAKQFGKGAALHMIRS